MVFGFFLGDLVTLTFSKSTRMSTFIASSKLNGWSEIGFAFGIFPPTVSVVEHFSPDTSSEPAVPVACSAACYYRREDVPVLPVVMTKRELGQVQRQIGLADVVIGADHAPLQQAPEAVQVGRVDVPAHILALRVVHGLVRVLPLQASIARMFIGRDQRDVFAHGLTDETAQRDAVRILDDLADHIALASNRADDADLIAARPTLQALLVPMAVLILAADVGFVYLHFSHELGKASILHRSADAVAHIPSRAVVAGTYLAMDLQGADALLALGHKVNDLEPDSKVIVGIFKDGLGNDGEAVAIPSAAILALTNPVKWLGLERIHLGILTSRAFHAIRPAHIPKKRLARFFRGEAMGQLRKGHGWRGRHRLASVQMSGVYAFHR